MAWIIEKVGRPALVIAHNKTLAAQLCNEFREFFPDNAVEYFVSYYDYYQPEAYIAQTDTYIEKDAVVNDDIDRLRHAATASLLTRRDVIIVASVSCIYGLGSPESYYGMLLPLETGQESGSGGYATQLSEETIRKQQELMAKTVAASDVIITTAVSNEDAEKAFPGFADSNRMGW